VTNCQTVTDLDKFTLVVGVIEGYSQLESYENPISYSYNTNQYFELGASFQKTHDIYLDE
jgi:hypothetical protein